MAKTLLALVVVCLCAAASTSAQEPCAPDRLEPPPQRFGAFAATIGRFWFIADDIALTRCPSPIFGCRTGAVHVYELVGGRLEFRQTLVPADISAGANFGWHVAVEGERLMVGAPFHTEPGGLPTRGMVYEYVFDGERWVESGRVPPPPEIEQGFGMTVALRGDTMVVRTVYQTPNAVNVYRRAGDEWTQEQVLSPGPEAVNWRFGYRMHLDDDWLFVGAFGDDSILGLGGSVSIYRRETDGTFTFSQKLAPDFRANLGFDVAYDGRSLIVGAPAYSPEFRGQGGIFAYVFDGDRWVINLRITLDDALGMRLAVDGDTMLAQAVAPHWTAGAPSSSLNGRPAACGGRCAGSSPTRSTSSACSATTSRCTTAWRW